MATVVRDACAAVIRGLAGPAGVYVRAVCAALTGPLWRRTMIYCCTVVESVAALLHFIGVIMDASKFNNLVICICSFIAPRCCSGARRCRVDLL